MDASTYPRLAEYVGLLPDGLDSYPECKTKAVMVHTAVHGADLAALPHGLPPVVAQLIDDPPGAALWIPAAHADAVFFAMVDAFYPTEAKVRAWTRRRVIRTSKSKLYRALSRIAGPATLLKLGSAMHRLFQKGTDLEVERRDTPGMRAQLLHPPYLHGGLNHLSNVAMFEAVIEMAGGLAPKVSMTASEPTRAVYEATWT